MITVRIEQYPHYIVTYMCMYGHGNFMHFKYGIESRSTGYFHNHFLKIGISSYRLLSEYLNMTLRITSDGLDVSEKQELELGDR